DLEEDDISAMILTHSPENHFSFIRPPENFSFPEEERKEFVPTSLKPDNSENFTAMQMDEIRHQFNGVANDFRKVKKKQKRQELLLLLMIFLLFANLGLLFLFRPKTEVKDSSSNNTAVLSNPINKL